MGDYPKINNSLNLNYRNGKFNSFASINGNYRKGSQTLDIYRELLDNSKKLIAYLLKNLKKSGCANTMLLKQEWIITQQLKQHWDLC